MFTYRLHLADGSDAGEAVYAQMIHMGDEIHLGGGRRFRVLDVVLFDAQPASMERVSSVPPSVRVAGKAL